MVVGGGLDAARVARVRASALAAVQTCCEGRLMSETTPAVRRLAPHACRK